MLHGLLQLSVRVEVVALVRCLHGGASPAGMGHSVVVGVDAPPAVLTVVGRAAGAVVAAGVVVPHFVKHVVVYYYL